MDATLTGYRDLVLEALKQNGLSLQYADESLKNDKSIVLEAVKSWGGALEYAHEDLRKDRDIVLEAIKNQGMALEYAHEDFRKDRDIVLEAVKQDWVAFKFAADTLKSDPAIYNEAKAGALEAMRTSGLNSVRNHIDPSLWSDRAFVLEAIKIDYKAMEYADLTLKVDSSFVLEAMKINISILMVADNTLKADRDFILKAIQQNTHALKFAAGGLNQDRKLLKKAGLDFAGSLQQSIATIPEWIVMSVKFGLHAEASDFSTDTHNRIVSSDFLRAFNLHDPNAFNKLFCGKLPNGEPNWDRATDIEFPCRGTQQTCQLPAELNGHPTSGSCWRYSFGWYLRAAKTKGGIMLQAVERNKGDDGTIGDLDLGGGQKIEEEMARSLDLKIFRLEQACRSVELKPAIGSIVQILDTVHTQEWQRELIGKFVKITTVNHREFKVEGCENWLQQEHMGTPQVDDPASDEKLMHELADKVKNWMGATTRNNEMEIVRKQ